MRDLTVDLLKHLFDYDKETGNLIWKVSRGAAKKGSVVGCLDTALGYVRVSIDKKQYYAHRLIFLMHKGYLPRTIDHINGDRADNHIENLRAASAGQNQHNRKQGKNNTSGYKGVSYVSSRKKWSARVQLECKSLWLGHYNTPEEADAVARKAREELHGSFANHGDAETVSHENTEG
jgi:hypothetical protein